MSAPLSDNEIAKLAQDLWVLRELLLESGAVGPVWADVLTSAQVALLAENERANKAELGSIIGTWGKDDSNHAVHWPSYHKGLEEGKTSND